MTFQIRPAERRQARLRLGLCSPSGGGKTMSALLLAKGMARAIPGSKIGVIDSERQSASLYADVVQFDVLDLSPPYSPERYREALHALERAGYNIIIVDQISHAWAGEGGLLEYVDTLKAQARNAISPWAKATPEQNRLVDAILRSPAHIICTLRAKTEWVMEEQIVDGRKKQVPRKIGLAPVQRDGIEYEFTTMLDLDVGSNTATASKDRSRIFAGQTIRLTEEWGEKLANWLLSAKPEEASPAPQESRQEASAPPASPEATAPAPSQPEPPQQAAGAVAATLISTDQQTFIRKALAESGIKDEAFCRAANVQAIGLLPSVAFERACDWIDRVKKAHSGASGRAAA